MCSLQVQVRDETDGTYSVEYYFYSAGLFQIAIHGVGSESATSGQPFDSVDGVGDVYTYTYTQHVI